MAIGTKAFVILALLVAACATSASLEARSVYSPRHSGMEPPGGPRPLEALPGNSPTRTPEGGMGYVDAYGNTLRDEGPREEASRRPRPRNGAYGGKPESKSAAPAARGYDGPPLWRYK